MSWMLGAAVEIDKLLADAVVKNTGIDAGFFSGVSQQDIALVIQKHYEGEKTKCEEDAVKIENEIQGLV